MKIWQKTVAVVATLALLFNSIAAPLTVLAQEATPEPTPEATVEPTTAPEATPTETATPTPEATDSTLLTASPEVTPTATPEATIEATTTPTATPEITPTPTPSPWTFEKVELNKEYQASGVKLMFTKLPSPAGNIKIEEITLTEDQIKQTGSLSNKAYDITSDMTDGSFSYNLSLPIPEASKGKAVEVKFAEELSNIGTAEKVENTLTKTDTSVSVTSLDHFTVFILTAFDGVNIGTNSYTVSSGITATYITGTGTESDPVKLKLTGYAPIVTPWFGIDKGWTTYNYVTIGISLPADFIGIPIAGGTTASSTGVIRYDRNPGNYEMGTGSTALATDGAAKGYLDYSFAANSPNTKKDGLVKLQVIWNVGGASEYFTIDINGLQTGPVFIDTNKDGNFDSGELSFNTIQAAIDVSASGDTIHVDAGEYTEQIIINKSLDLIGAGETSTTILAPNTISSTFTNVDAEQMNPVVTIINGVSVNISLLKIDGVGKGNANNQFVGIGLYNAGGSIDHVTITNIKETPLNGDQGGGDAIYAYNEDGLARTLDISNSTISNYQKNGMTLKGAGLSVDVSGNTVTGAGPTSIIGQNGIQVSDGATGTITDNQVSGHVYTPGSWWAAGILVYQSDGVTVSDNVVSANQAGIYIFQGSNNSVDNNIITGNSNSQAGVMVTKIIHDDVSSPATANTINHNTITGGFTGIWTSYTYGNTYSNNTISNSTGNGIYSWDSDDNIFSGNNISGVHNADNGGWGIALDGGDTSGTIGSDSNAVSNNTVETSDVGIWVGNGSDDNTLTDNTLSGNSTGAQVDTYFYVVLPPAPAGLHFHGNSFTGSTIKEFTNSTAVAVDATNNWWGTSISTEIAAKAIGLIEDDFTPWYVNSGMTILSDAVTGDTVTAPSGDSDLELSSDTSGEAGLPDGVTDVVLDNDSGLDLSAGLVGNAVTLQSGVPARMLS